jgi:hypothetical protein
MNKIVSSCPVCGKDLFVETLSCECCKTKINGQFELSMFDHLTKEQLSFVLLYFKVEGNIKEIEKYMNISYPTVKKYINDIKNVLKINDEKSSTREEVLLKLKNKEISFEDAERILGDLK